MRNKTKNNRHMKKIPQDIIGDIAILKFKRNTPWLIKKYKGWRFLKIHKNINTVLEKIDKFSGVLRIPKTTYKENNCFF